MEVQLIAAVHFQNIHVILAQTFPFFFCILMHCIQHIGFEKMKKETSEYHNVFYEDKHVCNKGRARYQLDLAPVKKFPVSADFAATVCALPGSYNEKAYFNFLEDWGTVNLFKCY